MKKNHKRIILLLTVFVALCCLLNTTYAAITTSDGGVSTDSSIAHTIASGLLETLGIAGEVVISSALASITSLIATLSLVIFTALQLFLTGTTNNLVIAMPDTIVFNRFPFFDANFINPHENSLIKTFGDVLGNLFESFRTIAIAIFIIAAMITGLKLALSTIAAKKAQYKEVAMKWITGFLVLIFLKWIIAGIFYINEILVSMLFNASAEIMIPIYVGDAFSGFWGLTITAIEQIMQSSGLTQKMELPGYLGIAISNIVKAYGGDIIASIVGFIIIGQTLTVVGSYLKRVFMCVLLGLVAPLIVAADTILASTGQASKLFANWLKNFATTVFIQSIHAVYMIVALQMLSSLYTHDTLFAATSAIKQMHMGIITIVLTTGLIKLEKLIKNLFGVGDSLAGDLKDGSKGFKAALGAGMGLMAAGKALADNAPKMKDSSKRIAAYDKELAKEKNNLANKKAVVNNNVKNNSVANNSGAKNNIYSEQYKKAMEAARDAKHRGDTAEYNKQMKKAWAARRQEVMTGMAGRSNQAGGSGTANSNGTTSAADAANIAATSKNSSKNNSGSYLDQVMQKYDDPENLTTEEKIQKLEEAKAAEMSKYRAAQFANVMGVANLAAGIGMGLGMGDDFGESLMKGGMITAALDRATEFAGSRAADKDRRNFYEAEKEAGKEYGYAPSEKIIRQKSKFAENITNPDLPFSPADIAREVAKPFEEIADVYSGSMARAAKSNSGNTNTVTNNNTTNNTTKEKVVERVVEKNNYTVNTIAANKELTKQIQRIDDVTDSLDASLKQIDRYLDNN